MSFSRELRAAFVAACGETPATDGLRWGRWLDVVTRDRLGAMLAHLDVPVAAHLRRFEQTVLSRHVLLMFTADRIFEAMARRGIEVIPLKGYVLAREVYPRPGMRDMTDIDLLVRRPEIPAAAAALMELGWTPPPRIDPSHVPARSGSINAMMFRAPEGAFHHVHLHWDVYNSSIPMALALPQLPLDEIREAARPAGPGLRLLDRTHLAVLIAEHAFKHSFHELVMLVDFERARTKDVERVARRWGLGLPLEIAQRLIEALRTGTPTPVRGMRGLDGRWFVRSVTSDRRWNGLSGLGYLSMMPGLAGRARFVRELFFPAEEAVLHYGRSPGWRETWRRMRRAAKMATSDR